jgi:hypothetical protein
VEVRKRTRPGRWLDTLLSRGISWHLGRARNHFDRRFFATVFTIVGIIVLTAASLITAIAKPRTVEAFGDSRARRRTRPSRSGNLRRSCSGASDDD